MLLSPRQTQQLQCTLWNKLTGVLSETMDPLRVERH